MKKEVMREADGARASAFRAEFLAAALTLLLCSACGSDAATGPIVNDTDVPEEVGAPDALETVNFDLPVVDTGQPAACVPATVTEVHCAENGDCASGWCMLHLAEKVCSQACIEECPPGWSCEQMGATGSDPVFVCVSDYPSLCLPCSASVECGAPTRCAEYPDGAGGFCGTPCKNTGDCPCGYECQEMTTAEGDTANLCVVAEGECACTEHAVGQQLGTTCTVTNEHGVCAGWRKCTAEGLTECSAAEPAPEECDGKDNDCDGVTDEEDVCLACVCGDGECNKSGCDECWKDCLEMGEESCCTCATDCAICGNGTCDPGEGPVKCPGDCCGSCGDGVCKGGECQEDAKGTDTYCAADCKEITCGNGVCEPGEDDDATDDGIDACPEDCGKFACGNGTCEPGENPQACPDDCGATCGDCQCNMGESYLTCPVDCGYCGDGYCINKCEHIPETEATCPADCGCMPDCTDKECGDDGCGGSCGECDEFPNSVCDEEGQCQCDEDCADKECGSDGCGGECGTCAAHHECVEGTCIYLPYCGDETCDAEQGETCQSCQPDCGCEDPDVCYEEACCTPETCGSAGYECGEWSDGCGDALSCGACVEFAGSLCNEQGQCDCVADCGGKECGDNGCGGSCGTCSGQDECEQGQCVCQPDCGGKKCGDDGCGGSCGTCQLPLSCVEGSCVGCGDGECGAGEDNCNCPADCADGCVGCCAGSECKSGDTLEFCGTGGEACDECVGGEECEAGSCLCVVEDHKECAAGDVYWFDSCGGQGEKAEECGDYACDGATCLPPSSCKVLHDQGPGVTDGVYLIDPDGDGELDPFEAYCDMENGGWTLVLKATAEAALAYDSEYWEDSGLLDAEEFTLIGDAKYPAFLHVPVSEMRACLDAYCYAKSFDGNKTSREIFAGGADIVSGHPGFGSGSNWSTQPHCQHFGINTPWHTMYGYVRFGYTANNENNCDSNDTAIGLGIPQGGAGFHCGASGSGCSKGEVHAGAQGLLWVR